MRIAATSYTIPMTYRVPRRLEPLTLSSPMMRSIMWMLTEHSIPRVSTACCVSCAVATTFYRLQSCR